MTIPEAQLETWSKQGSVTQSKATYDTVTGFRCRPESRPSCPNVRFPPNYVSFRSESGPGAEGPFSSAFDPFRTSVTEEQPEDAKVH